MIVLAAIAAASVLNAASAPPAMIGSLEFGIGNQSCAHWLASPISERDGKNWLFGFWSATNRLNAPDRVVGANTDGDGIVGEVRKICLAEPSTELGDAVARVYYRMFRADRGLPESK